MQNLPLLTTGTFTGKKVLLRADTDVPLKGEGKGFVVADDMRLSASLPTITFLLSHGATIILIGHLGRPEGKDMRMSLLPVARWFKDHCQLPEIQEQTITGFDGWKLTDNFFVLENLRFHQEETANDEAFASRLASLADIYVNDAFAMSHRNHASVVGVATKLPHYAGLRLAEEVQTLQHAMEDPKRPLVVIIGGKKIETKLPLVKKMLIIADHVLVGGKIAQEAGEKLQEHNELLGENKAKLVLATLGEDGLDITRQSTDEFIRYIMQAETIIWNGPMGKIEDGKKERMTTELARAIGESHAYKIVGGGDTVEFLHQMHVAEHFDFISTGGGAMLSFLSGEELPGVTALLALS